MQWHKVEGRDGGPQVHPDLLLWRTSPTRVTPSALGLVSCGTPGAAGLTGLAGWRSLAWPPREEAVLLPGSVGLSTPGGRGCPAVAELRPLCPNPQEAKAASPFEV